MSSNVSSDCAVYIAGESEGSEATAGTRDKVIGRPRHGAPWDTSTHSRGADRQRRGKCIAVEDEEGGGGVERVSVQQGGEYRRGDGVWLQRGMCIGVVPVHSRQYLADGKCMTEMGTVYGSAVNDVSQQSVWQWMTVCISSLESGGNRVWHWRKRWNRGDRPDLCIALGQYLSVADRIHPQQSATISIHMLGAQWDYPDVIVMRYGSETA